MKHILGFIFLCWTLTASAEVIDRIAAVVDGHIITQSDLRRERQTRIQLGEKPLQSDAMLARDMVDNYLIDKQIADYPNIEVTEAEVNAEAPSPELRDAVRRRIRIQKFFDVKFRQMIRTTPEDVRKYYDEVFVPEARARNLQPIPPLSDPDMARAIQENVIEENMNHEVDVWLQAIRRRSNIEIFE